jgi:hypothetical protein
LNSNIIQEYFENLMKLDEGGNHLPVPLIVCPHPVEDPIPVVPPDT